MEDEKQIDLFNILEELWIGKWIIIKFLFISFACGILVTFLMDQKFESKIKISITMPHYNVDKYFTNKFKKSIQSDFKRLFFSKENFESWRNLSENSVVTFQDFRNTKMIDDVVISIKNNKLVSFTSNRKNELFLVIKSNDIKISNDFFKYLNYVKKSLISKLVIKLNNEFDEINKNSMDTFKQSDSYNNFVIKSLTMKYKIENSNDFISIEHPTKPRKISPRIFTNLTIATIFGAIISVFLLLFNNLLKKRKKIKNPIV